MGLGGAVSGLSIRSSGGDNDGGHRHPLELPQGF
jgi:hypothetical protein